MADALVFFKLNCLYIFVLYHKGQRFEKRMCEKWVPEQLYLDLAPDVAVESGLTNPKNILEQFSIYSYSRMRNAVRFRPAEVGHACLPC